jgi:hypothetical protein
LLLSVPLVLQNVPRCLRWLCNQTMIPSLSGNVRYMG